MAGYAQSAAVLFAKWSAGESSWHDGLARTVQLSTALAFGVTGLVFAARPFESAQFLGMKLVNLNGEIEFRAFYGTMEICLGMSLAALSCAPSLAVSGAILFGSSFGRIFSSRSVIRDLVRDGRSPSHGFDAFLHSKIALAEACGSLICLWAHIRETNAKAKREAASANLRRRQSPDPKTPADFVPYCAENLQDPYPWYKALRDECPVSKPDGLDYYLVSRAQDIQTVCKDSVTFSSKLVAILVQGPGGSQSTLDVQGFDAFTGGVVDVLALQDAPQHTVHRKCAFNGLSPKLFATMDDAIRARARKMLTEGFQGKSCVDWMDTMAFRLPMFVALELCGFPSDPATARRVKAQADHGVALMSGTNTPEEFANHAMQARELFKWVQREFAEVRTNATKQTTDFIASLLKGISSGDLNVSEAESIILQILLAGNDSSASTMGSAMKILCERPDIQAEVRRDPETLIPVFVEEVLRYESPFGGHFRSVKNDTVLSGVQLHKGDRVMVLWASGNRDERYFDAPDEFRLDRGAKGKTHFSFGNGSHLCLGNSLARREVRIVLEETLAMFGTIKQSPNGPRPYYIPSSFARSLARYHVDLA